MANLRVRNLNDHFDLNEGAQVALPDAHQQLENSRAGGELQQQMVPRYDQLPEVVNAQAPYPHQQVLQQQMAGGPDASPVNTGDLAVKGAMNAQARQEVSAGNEYLDRVMLGMVPGQPPVVTGGGDTLVAGVKAGQRMAQRRPNA